jgi:hypothetical protein
MFRDPSDSPGDEYVEQSLPDMLRDDPSRTGVWFQKIYRIPWVLNTLQGAAVASVKRPRTQVPA